MGDDCASVGTSCQESILLLGVGVPKDECFVSKCCEEGLEGGGESDRSERQDDCFSTEEFSVNYALSGVSSSRERPPGGCKEPGRSEEVSKVLTSSACHRREWSR